MKWGTTLQFETELKTVTKEAFNVCFKTSEDTAIQWLQFRLLHRILPVNKYLKQLKIKSSDTCSFCGELEDIPHLFFLCQNVSRLWNKLSLHILNKIRRQVGFHLMNILFGEKPLYNNIPFNFIILSSKLYIFKCTRQHKIPEINGLIHHLTFGFKVEQYIARRNNQLETFNINWDGWKPIFVDP